MKIEKSDRRLLLWAGAAVFLVVVALAFLSEDDEESSVPSTYSAQNRGAKAAFLLLQEAGYKVERWEQSPTELPEDPANTVLVLASPFRTESREEKDALKNYVSRGGKILATGSNASSYLPQADADLEPLTAPSWKEYQPEQLTPLTRGGAIQMSPGAYWKGAAISSLAHYADDGRPIVVSYKVGHGEVIWWAASTPLTNAAIANSGNMALLLNSLGRPGDASILWDEYFHGYRGSSWWYLHNPPVAYGLLQCALIFLVTIFTFSRRNGPIHPLPEPSRLSPLEFVSTLGKLYHRANAVHSALAVPYARFRSLAARQLGINQDLPIPELARAVQNRLRYKDDGFEDLLQQIENALRDPALSEEAALDLVQKLNRHMQNLRMNPLERQETNVHADRVTGAHARTN
jgi:Domain of unknown function (DUF4350)